jgi:SAM-dependent methyltransferase
VPVPDAAIERKEDRLREWFTRSAVGPRRTIDALDIGWGGVQRWATSIMPDLGSGRHLDFACGYATFLAQLGWRFPDAELVGLNIDFRGAHATAGDLLEQAGVGAELVEADARDMPFSDASFDSATCFMGLQDIELAFGERGLLEALRESARVLRPEGTLCLLDECSFERYETLLRPLDVTIDMRDEHDLDVKWDRDTAEHAIRLYAEGWLEQKRLGQPGIPHSAGTDYAERLRAEAESQLSEHGYYVPFGPVRVVVCRKAVDSLRGSPRNQLAGPAGSGHVERVSRG